MKISLVALALGIILGVVLPPQAFKEGFEGMLTFLGLVFASVVPAMALTVSTLRASRRSVREVRLLRLALQRQLSFWMSFLGVTGGLAVLLLVASVLGWPGGSIRNVRSDFFSITLTPMSILNSGITFLLLLTLAKAPAFAKGMRDLLNLHLDQVEAESLAALQEEHQAIAGTIGANENDRSFGRLINDQGSDR